MKVIVTGATGMLGKGVLLECLDHKDITGVLSISRRTAGISHPKLTEIIHSDFLNYLSIRDQLIGYDACYACMGVSSAGKDEEQYTLMTRGFTLALASILYDINPDITFNYISGQGTDSSEKGRSMWARVKGRTENDLLKMGFKQAYMFRPGAIIPKRGVRASSNIYRVLIFIFGWLLFILKYIFPNSIVDTVQIGRSMINSTQRGYEKKIIDPVDIHILAK